MRGDRVRACVFACSVRRMHTWLGALRAGLLASTFVFIRSTGPCLTSCAVAPLLTQGACELLQLAEIVHAATGVAQPTLLIGSCDGACRTDRRAVCARGRVLSSFAAAARSWSCGAAAPPSAPAPPRVVMCACVLVRLTPLCHASHLVGRGGLHAAVPWPRHGKAIGRGGGIHHNDGARGPDRLHALCREWQLRCCP